MGKIDLTIHKEGLAHNIQKAKENNIIIPTIAQMQNPDTHPRKDQGKAGDTGLHGTSIPSTCSASAGTTRPRRPAACSRRSRTTLRSRPPFPA